LTSRHEHEGPTNHGRLVRKEIWTKSEVSHERVVEGFALETITIIPGRRSWPNLFCNHQRSPKTMRRRGRGMHYSTRITRRGSEERGRHYSTGATRRDSGEGRIHSIG
jgi:hypothetical protein